MIQVSMPLVDAPLDCRIKWSRCQTHSLPAETPAGILSAQASCLSAVSLGGLAGGLNVSVNQFHFAQ